MFDFKNTDFISSANLGRNEIEFLLKTAQDFLPFARKEKTADLLKGKILAALFYEPSTRTRLSFETAMHRLGGSVINVIGMESSSLMKGETLWDTAKVVENFADIIAIRHPQIGSALECAKAASIPVINAGDGAGEHPTQAFLDIFTIQQEKGQIDNLSITLVGDLKNQRAIHSWIYLLSHFKAKLFLVSANALRIPEEMRNLLVERGVEFEETEDMVSVMEKTDVIYMTRVFKERFANMDEYEKYKDSYNLTRALIEKHNPELLILHVLPRISEISQDVDDLPGAAYFRQVQNGVAARMALLTLLLGMKV